MDEDIIIPGLTGQTGSMTYQKSKFTLNYIERNGEKIDISEFNVKSSVFETTGDLLFYAFKELKRLRAEIEDMKKRLSEDK